MTDAIATMIAFVLACAFAFAFAYADACVKKKEKGMEKEKGMAMVMAMVTLGSCPNSIDPHPPLPKTRFVANIQTPMVPTLLDLMRTNSPQQALRCSVLSPPEHLRNNSIHRCCYCCHCLHEAGFQSMLMQLLMVKRTASMVMNSVTKVMTIDWLPSLHPSIAPIVPTFPDRVLLQSFPAVKTVLHQRACAQTLIDEFFQLLLLLLLLLLILPSWMH
jgi:hypothetical protein